MLMCKLIIVVVYAFLQISTAQIQSDSQNERDQDPYRRTTGGRRPCDTEQIEYRLTRLEVQVGEKSENLRSEVREGNRRLQALEYQGSEVGSALESFRAELSRFSDTGLQSIRSQENNNNKCSAFNKLDTRIDNLNKGMQLVVAALRGLNLDIAWVRKNITEIVNSTGILLQNYHHLVTKQFLSHALLDVKHNQYYHPVPANIFSTEQNKSQVPRNCKEVLEAGHTQSGIYKIQPDGAAKSIMALCNMETRGGGWTYIHNRFEGSQDFYLNWHDYKYGFGNIGGEFWFGLENIYLLTGNEVNELLVELVDMNMEKAHAHYSAFSLGSEVEGYALKVLGGYSGDAGDSLIYHAGSRFSTKDLDQDSWVDGNCATSHGGAWWYRGCDTSNLNGKYLNGELPESFLYQGMYWGEFRGAQYSLAQARMMIRPRDANALPFFPEVLQGSKKKL